MPAEQGTILRTAPYLPSRTRILPRPNYEGWFGVLLIAVLLLSTLDEAVAPLARGVVLMCFGLLTVVNAGAAAGVYIGAALIFSMQASGGTISWVQRPDNFALLFLTFYLIAGRCVGRPAGTFGTTGMAVAALVGTTLIHLVLLVGVDWYWMTWCARMFVIPLGLFVLLRRAGLAQREVRALLTIVAVMAVYLAAITLLEAIGSYNLLVPPWLADPSVNPGIGNPRIGGLAMQAEWNALDLSLAFCVVLLQLRQGQRLVRGVWLGAAALCLVAIYLTYTRAAWLGLMLAGLPLLWQKSAARGVTLRRRVLFVLGSISFATVVLFFPGPVLESRVSEAGTIYFRFSVWTAGLGMIIQHPFFGVGFGQFGSLVGSYVRDLAWIPSSDAFRESASAHNTLLAVTAELGLIGLILYLLVLRGVVRAAWVAAGAAYGREGRTWVASITVVYLVNVQFITAHELTPNLLFFAVLGAIAGMRGLADPSPEGKQA